MPIMKRRKKIGGVFWSYSLSFGKANGTGKKDAQRYAEHLRKKGFLGGGLGQEIP